MRTERPDPRTEAERMVELKRQEYERAVERLAHARWEEWKREHQPNEEPPAK